MYAISAEAIRRSWEFHGQSISNIAWAFAVSLMHHPPLMAALSAGARGHLTPCVTVPGNFTPQDLSNLVWSIAKLLVHDAPLLDAISGAALRSMCEFAV